jgi:hypothetical protein
MTSKEKQKAAVKKWAIDNKPRMKELQSTWEKKNDEARKAYKKKYYQENKEKVLADTRKFKLLRKYGITIPQYESMYTAQNGVCAICKRKTNENLRVDHCHKTGKVRGLLCHNCNTGIGHFRDSIDLLNTTIAYLKSTA